MNRPILGAARQRMTATPAALPAQARARKASWFDRATLSLFAMIAPHGVRPASAGQARAQLFPQVDFARLRLADLIRIPVQLLWLALVRPQAADAPGPFLASLQRLQVWRGNVVRFLRQAAHRYATGSDHLAAGLGLILAGDDLE